MARLKDDGAETGSLAGALDFVTPSGVEEDFILIVVSRLSEFRTRSKETDGPSTLHFATGYDSSMLGLQAIGAWMVVHEQDGWQEATAGGSRYGTGGKS
jgi:hypothetical protein